MARKFAWMLTLPLLGLATAFANPYTLPAGTTALTVQLSYWDIRDYFGGNGKKSGLPFEIQQTDLIAVLEHGLTDRLMLTAILPYSNSKLDVPGQASASNKGASDLGMSLKYRLGSDVSVWTYSVGVNLKWPGDYKANLPNAPGDGNFDAELVAAGARKLGDFIVSANLGYRLRNGNPDNELLLRLQPSYRLGGRLILFGSLDIIDSLGGLTFEQVVLEGKGQFNQLEEDTTRLGGGLYYSLSSKLGVFAGLTETLGGHSTANGARWRFGAKLSF